MCENPGVCTFIRLRRCPAIHLVSKNAHSCSRNHCFTHLVSKTAPSCSRTPAILACPPTIRARLASIPCQPRRQLCGRLARSRFFGGLRADENGRNLCREEANPEPAESFGTICVGELLFFVQVGRCQRVACPCFPIGRECYQVNHPFRKRKPERDGVLPCRHPVKLCHRGGMRFVGERGDLCPYT